MLIAADASQLEWRLAVEFSRDPVGIQEIIDKLDIHANNQAELALPSRLIAKKFLFRTIFRGSGWAFANDNEFKHVSSDAEYWDERNRKFYSKYAGLDSLHKRWTEQVYTTGRITGFSGRVWLFERRERRGRLEYSINEYTNWPVQGTGNDLIAIARVSLRNRLTKGKIPAIIISTIHDSIVVDSPNKYATDVAKVMIEVFDDIPKNIKRLFNHEVAVPFPCEVKMGRNLLEMEKFAH
jgi:DNA polymerase-1